MTPATHKAFPFRRSDSNSSWGDFSPPKPLCVRKTSPIQGAPAFSRGRWSPALDAPEPQALSLVGPMDIKNQARPKVETRDHRAKSSCFGAELRPVSRSKRPVLRLRRSSGWTKWHLQCRLAGLADTSAFLYYSVSLSVQHSSCNPATCLFMSRAGPHGRPMFVLRRR